MSGLIDSISDVFTFIGDMISTAGNYAEEAGLVIITFFTKFYSMVFSFFNILPGFFTAIFIGCFCVAIVTLVIKFIL